MAMTAEPPLSESIAEAELRALSTKRDFVNVRLRGA
jgi:hypothetical protein